MLQYANCNGQKSVCKSQCAPCSVQGMSNEDIQSLQQVVDDQVQENLGMAMIYTIVTAAQEWMQEHVSTLLLSPLLNP